MNAFPAFILSGIIAAMAVPASAQTAESANGPKVTYPAFNDGSHIHGPKLKTSDLKGKVVFLNTGASTARPASPACRICRNCRKNSSPRALLS